jgi:hypothetical protein
MGDRRWLTCMFLNKLCLCQLLLLVLCAQPTLGECSSAFTSFDCYQTTCCPNNMGVPCEWVVERKRAIGTCQCRSSACCPQDCMPLSWTDWSPCSATCGSGTRSRSLSFVPPSCGGSPCSSTFETESCYPGGCPVDCQVSSWSAWTCSAACGAGTEMRTRYVTVSETNGGMCPEMSSLSESRTCNNGCCPVNCQVYNWSAWSGCTKVCGGGIQTRSRSITPASCGGSCSQSATSDTQGCNTQCCPTNCIVGDWSAWSACSAMCGGGGGSQSRSRSITAASCGGSCAVSQTSESQSCVSARQDCQLSEWSQWSACSQTCGSGSHSRSRSIAVVAACGGAECPTLLSMSGVCGGGCCPSDCVWSAFTAWSGCSVSCGNGIAVRSRTVQTQPVCGGLCPGNSSESVACGQPACALPPVDCEVGAWGAWSMCSLTCGATATKTRSRSVMHAAANGGTGCPMLVESTNCGLSCCPVACVVSQWASWAPCSASCGSGVRSRMRSVVTDTDCGGVPCPSLTDSEPCAAAVACAVDCVLGAWTDWSTCSQSCGTGEQRRTRSVLTPPSAGGALCGAMSESLGCSYPNCACQLTAWSAWSTCSAACGGGTATRSRNVTMSASDCPHLTDSSVCGALPCARDCVLSTWSLWSACSVSCGGGRRSRMRSVMQTAVEPGMACPLVLVESMQCAIDVCAPGPRVLACADFSTCLECTEHKSSPHACQYCMNGEKGECTRIDDGNGTSTGRDCPMGQRVIHSDFCNLTSP